jgi:WD40 repeat protein
VQEVLDDWKQFLHEQAADDGPRYSVYHFSFREFLHRIDIVQAAGVQIKDINIQISSNLWEGLFGAADLSDPDVLAAHDLQTRLNQLSPEARSYAYVGLCKNLIAARQFERLDVLLTNLEFLAARVDFGGPSAAIRDYRAARIAQAEEWAEDGGPAQFLRFLDRRSQFLRSAPDLIFQEAFNSDEARVQTSAANLRKAGRFSTGPWLRKLTGAAEDQHSGQAISMAFWGDERYLTVSTSEREVWVWDCLTGRVRTRCDAPPSPAKSLAVSPAGDHLAAGYGSALPTPLQAGVLAWDPDGGVAWNQALDEWVYAVRWRSETEILAGGGLPSGSEAVGTLWKIDVAAARSTELGNWLADRPVLLTWDPVAGDAEQVMALAQDGFVLHLRPEYVAISPEEAQELSLKLLADGDYDAHDTRMLERRPVVSRICAPTADQDGYLCTAVTNGAMNRIYVLGEEPVPPEMLMFHTPVPDGIYMFNPDDGQLSRSTFSEEAVTAGFRALCIAASPAGDMLAMGTAHGVAYLFPLSDPDLAAAPEPVHEGTAPVTAICFSGSGRRLAVGDAVSQIAVYDLPDGEPVMHTRRGESVVAAQVDDDRQVVLFADRLEVSSHNATPIDVTLTWNDGMRAVDLARCGDLAVILCVRTNLDRESPDQEAEAEQALKVVDLRAPRVLVEAPVPLTSAIFAGGERGTSAGRAFHRIALLVDNGQCLVYLGSVYGVVEFSFLVHDRYRIFALSEEETKRDREIRVIPIGSDEPDLACRIFTGPTHNGSLLSGYADNAAHPRVSGELHCWDTRTTKHSEVMRFASEITAIEATDGAVLLGTEQGDVVSLMHDGEWHRLAQLEHPAAISCVAFDESRQMACSVSRDGLVLLWDLFDGTRKLSTSMDVDPVHAAFTLKAKRLSIVDRSGQLHSWKLENRSGLGGTNPPRQNAGSTTASNKMALIEACLRAAEQVGRSVDAIAHGDPATAAALLSDLPDGPGGAEIQRYWQTVLQSMDP